MASKRNEIKAGLFIIATILGIAVILIAIKGGPHVTDPADVRRASFRLTDDLSGLRKGDDVRLGGYKVGVVKDIDVLTADPSDGEPRIVVSFSLPVRYKLHDTSLVTVQSTLTGNASLNIEKLGQGTDVALVQGHPGTFSVLASSLRGIAPEVQAVVHDVRTTTVPAVNHLVQHVDSKIDPVVNKYNGVADSAGKALTSVGELFGDSKPDFRATMASLNKVTSNVRDRLPAILDRLQSGLDKVGTTVDGARSAMEDVKSTAANTRDITASVRSILLGNRGKFDGIIASLKTTSDNLKGASIEVRRSPWRLLYKPTAEEMGNLNLYDSTREFAEGAGSLDDAAAALRDALHDQKTDPQRVQKLLQQLDESFNSFHQVEQKLWVAVKE